MWAKQRGCWTFLFARSQMCVWDSYNEAFLDYKALGIIPLSLLSMGCTCFQENTSKAFMAYAILTPLSIYDGAIAQAEGIILVLMSWTVWFACVGIKLYKRHLCQKNGQCLRRLLNIKDSASFESGYSVSCHLCKYYPPIFFLHIHLEYSMILYDCLRQNTYAY